MKQSKNKLRKQLLTQRRALTPELWRVKSDRLCDNLQSWSVFQNAKTILAYFCIQNEPDLTPLFSQKKWGFPRCVGDSLHWHHWQPTEVLTPGAYGILEPSPDAPTVSPQTVDLILVPAVACDSLGYRLGYGGGFYDRMLQQSHWSGIKAIAIIFDFAYLPELPTNVWDQKLDGVCTETMLISK